MNTRDDAVLTAELIRATMAGKAGVDGSHHGSVRGHRNKISAPPTSRRKCNCCGARATHVGLGDGLALMSGCEMSVRRWVRDGYPEAGL